jgi:hypothetical protein
MITFDGPLVPLKRVEPIVIQSQHDSVTNEPLAETRIARVDLTVQRSLLPCEFAPSVMQVPSLLTWQY